MIETDFRHSLAVLGLAQYHDPLVAEAFDSWPILAQITEQDLDTLNVRLGHRRILQRAIAEYRQSHRQPDSQPSSNTTERSLVPLAPYPTRDNAKKIQRVKRKYVRHPKVDENAPPPAPTGYVLFSNWVREGLREEKLDFPELAKIVGQKWQALPKGEKEIFLNKSKELKAQYLRQLAEYKRTASYREYQRYLADFRARNVGTAHSHKHLRSPRCETMAIDDQSNACRSRSESTAGDWPAELPPQSMPPSQHSLPSMQIREQNVPMRPSDPVLSPISGHAPFGNGTRLPAVYPPSSPNSDRCLQPPVNNLSTRQLPPLIPSFRT